MTDDELREYVALLVAGRMAMHWPLQCPLCPDRTAMALDIADALIAASLVADFTPLKRGSLEWRLVEFTNYELESELDRRQRIQNGP